MVRNGRKMSAARLTRAEVVQAAYVFSRESLRAMHSAGIRSSDPIVGEVFTAHSVVFAERRVNEPLAYYYFSEQ